MAGRRGMRSLYRSCRCRDGLAPGLAENPLDRRGRRPFWRSVSGPVRVPGTCWDPQPYWRLECDGESAGRGFLAQGVSVPSGHVSSFTRLHVPAFGTATVCVFGASQAVSAGRDPGGVRLDSAAISLPPDPLSGPGVFAISTGTSLLLPA